MTEEQLRILKLIEEGKISAEDGAKILNALNKGASSDKPGGGKKGRVMKIKFTDHKTGLVKFKFDIPLEWARMLNHFIPPLEMLKLEEQGIFLKKIVDSISDGTVGKIMDFDNKDTSDHVELWIE
jgi:hypothetical protein